MKIVFEFSDISDICKTDEELIVIAKRIKYGARFENAIPVQILRESGEAVDVPRTESPFCDDPDCESCNGLGADGHIY